LKGSSKSHVTVFNVKNSICKVTLTFYYILRLKEGSKKCQVIVFNY